VGDIAVAVAVRVAVGDTTVSVAIGVLVDVGDTTTVTVAVLVTVGEMATMSVAVAVGMAVAVTTRVTSLAAGVLVTSVPVVIWSTSCADSAGVATAAETRSEITRTITRHERPNRCIASSLGRSSRRPL
jgi:hypothetical protein